jgi:molecular chaperone GrpE
MSARKEAHPERGGTSREVPLQGDLAADLEAAREEAGRNLETAQRWQAEFENFRRRQAAQAEDQALRAGERVVERLLPVMDDLERTIDHTLQGGDLGHLLQGVEMVQKQLVDVLAREGAEVIDPFGEEFDPHVHQAVSQREDASLPEHTVVDVLQKGLRMHGRVLRPAMVVVSSGGPGRET